MTTYMGTPYERGKSDAIVTRKVDAPIEEGLFVYTSGENTVATVNGEVVPFGVMGQKEIAGSSVVVSGLKVKVQTDDEEQPTVGAQVYIVAATGKATAAEDGNIPTNATFASSTLETDGATKNTAVKANDRKCVAIDFPNGL